MDEFALIRRYFTPTQRPETVLLGVGDDCALLQIPAGQCLAVSVDTCVEGVHFPVSATGEQVATRALCTALSDLAAMGARPLWVTLALTLPSPKPDWLQAFSQGLQAMANTYGFTLVGGDTTCGPLTVTLQVHGAVCPNKALKRSGAKAGDGMYVTGYLGDGGAGLAVVQGQLQLGEAASQALTQRFYQPQPQLLAGQILAGEATACIDISDGLLADISHLCHASGLGAQVHLEQLPLSPHWASCVPQPQALQWALQGGDDYQLCFTLPPHKAPALLARLAQQGVMVTHIGQMLPTPGLCVLHQGQPTPFTAAGYTHFANQ